MLNSCQQYNNAVAADGIKTLVWMQKSNAAAEQQPLSRPSNQNFDRVPEREPESVVHLSNLVMVKVSVSEDYKKLAFKRFAQLGALTLSVEEFVDILFPTFVDEIEAEFLEIAREFNVGNIWAEVTNLIDSNEFDHPLILALHKNQLLREIIGLEYSFIDRYPKVFKKIYGDILPNMAINTKQVSIGLIGSSYGQELITTLKYLFSYLSDLEWIRDRRLTIDVLSKPNTVYKKLKSNSIIYPKSLITHYMSLEEINLCFVDVDSNNLGFSNLIYQNIEFRDLDLIDKDNLKSLSHKRYDLILLHNVIQYLEPEKGENLDFVCQFLDLILKEEGTISIINESKVINSYITRPFEQLYQLSGTYSQQVIESASLYTKVCQLH